MKLTKSQQEVMKAITLNPACKDDDKLLLAEMWKPLWDNGDSLYNNLRRVRNPESITRARRKLHELGLITYSKEAMERRTEEFERYRDENSGAVYVGLEM